MSPSVGHSTAPSASFSWSAERISPILPTDTPARLMFAMVLPIILTGHSSMELYSMKEMRSPTVICPSTHITVPRTMTAIIWTPVITSPAAQNQVMYFPSLIQRSVYFSFCFVYLSISVFSRPKARTTLTPVRFSWHMAESLPSFWSASSNPFEIFRWKKREYPMMTGMKIRATRDRVKLMLNMNTRENTMIMTVRITWVSWVERKSLRVSTSDVDLWMRSPV